MTPSRPDLVDRACWCGAHGLDSFSEFYRLCSSCGTLVSQFNQGGDVSRVTDDAADLYGKDYWFSHMEADLGFVNIYERARRDLAERAPYWLRTLLRHRLPPGRVLELGSAHGGFVALLAQAGFEATGLELSSAIVEIARELFGVAMLTGPVEDQAIAPGSLNVIALMDVLEHLPDPTGSMRACLQALAADGFLLIQTPAYPEGVTYAEMQVTGNRFLEQLKANEHVYLFSARSLRQFFAALGCDQVTFEPALFSHYDMFVVVSRQPVPTFSAEAQVKALQTISGRLALAALDLYARSERAEAVFATADMDRTDRLAQVQTLTGQLEEAHARLVESETDRAARLGEIERLDTRLRAVEADSAARLEAAERAGAALVASEADRAARLEVIKAAETRFAELAREMNALQRRIAELEAAPSGLPSGSFLVTATLRIAVDVTPIRADGANGGAKPFVLELLRDLGDENRHTYTLLTTASNHDAFAAFEARGMTRLLVDGMAPPIGLARRGVDVLFCPMTSPQFAEPGVATVCTLYDLQHVAYPWFFSSDELAHRVRFYRALCERADAIVAISEFSRNALVEHFDVPADRTSVVPIAIHRRHAIPTATEAHRVLSALGVPGAPFAFYPANFWPHKNHRFLFLAFERFLRDVPDADLHLVLTGDMLDRGTEIRASIARMGLADRVHVLGFVTDVELAAIWREATLLVYPSLYEGFGIPVLEALQFGKPVLSSRAGSLPEVGGDDVAYFDARDPQTLIDALREVLRDLPAAARRSEVARQRIAQADSRHSADHYTRIFERVAADREARLRLSAEQLARVTHSRDEAEAALEVMRKALEASEADRAARLRVIEDQGRQLGELEGLRAAYQFSEADRAARLDVIEAQGRQMEGLARTIAELREQIQTLREANVKLERRDNRSIFQLFLSRMRGKP